MLSPAIVNAYVLDTTTHVVTDAASGKEWLQWTETTGMSVNDDFSSLSGGGWRVATNTDMSALYSDFFASVAWDQDENTYQHNSGTTTYNDGIDQSFAFGELFGWTQLENSIDVVTNILDVRYSNRYGTGALFGSDPDGDYRINGALLGSEYLDLSSSYGSHGVREHAILYNEVFQTTMRSDYLGIALVRQSVVANVPEPSTFALLGLGLCGLGWARRKSRA